MTPPLPLSQRLSLDHLLGGEPPLGKSIFGVNRDDVDAVVQSWRAAALAIHATDVEPLARASGPASRVAGALTATAEPARHALDSIGTRLTAMGTALTAFEATAEDSDDRAASELDALRER